MCIFLSDIIISFSPFLHYYSLYLTDPDILCVQQITTLPTVDLLFPATVL